MSRDFLIGLDLGSYAFRMIAARPNAELPDGIEVLAAASVPAAGIRRGSIIAIDEAARAAALVRAEIERDIGSAVSSAFVGVGGPHVSSIPSKGLVVVSRADNRIGADDIRRVVEAAGAVSLGQNVDVLTIVPREFSVDSERGIKDPEGMQGRRLEVDAVVLTSSVQHVKNLRQALSGSDIGDHEFMVGPIATGRGVLNSRQRELGVAVVDIGHGTTDIAVFEDGQILATAILPIGGAHLTNDIAIGLRCSIDAAEKVKHDYGIANAERVSKRETVEMRTVDPEQEDAVFSRRELAEIIDARLDEIFELVGAELKRIGRWRLLPGGVVLTGGTANIPGIVDAARKAFHLPVQLGYPHVVGGPKDIVSDFSYVTAFGLVLAAVDASDTRQRRRGGVRLPRIAVRGFGGRLFGALRSLLP